jgi:hypothetical protein
MPRLILPRPIEIPIGPSIAYVPLTQGQYALIDSDDVHLVQDYAWYAALNASSGLFYAKRRDGDARMPIHHAIMGKVEGKTVDHINCSESLDNRRANLRHASANLQMWNRRTFKNNTSGFTGTFWEAKKKLWRAIIVHHNKRINLGRFKSQIDAARAYDTAALKLRGEVARLNLREV